MNIYIRIYIGKYRDHPVVLGFKTLPSGGKGPAEEVIIQTYVYKYVNICIYVYICIRMYICIHMYKNIYICIRMYIYIHIHVFIDREDQAG
jgi:hypothetical protein